MTELSSSPGSSANVLNIGLPSSVPSLDPATCRDAISLLVVSAIFETPYRPPSEFGPAEPLLFTGPLELQVDGPDRWIYAGSLREGVTFSDGTPLTGEIAVQALNRTVASIRSVKISLEGSKILFELESPNPRFDLTLTLAEASILLEKDGKLLGTGPFVEEEFSREEIRLLRNDRYRSKVSIEEIRYKVYVEDDDGGHAKLIDAVKSGEVDLANCLSRSEVTPLTGLCKKFLPSNSTAILYLNTERPGLDNQKVRQAIIHSIDRREATGICHSNILAFAAQSLLPPSMGLARDNVRSDLEKAQSLLAEAGSAAPKSLKLLVAWARRPYLPEPRAVGEVLARQIGKLGIQVQVEPGGDASGSTSSMGAGEFFDRLEKADYDMTLVGWIADTPDPADFLDTNLASSCILHPGKEGVSSMNLARWNDPDTDTSLEAFRKDPGFATESKVLEIVAEQAPLLPIMYGPSIVVHSWKVKGLRIRADGMPVYDLLELGK